MGQELRAIVRSNLDRVRERIAKAAARAGRPDGDIRLVAVTKYVGLELTRAIIEAGCPDLGESRPQQLWQKAGALADHPITWHLIGHLQRNKVGRTLPLVGLIHSLDSERLAAAIHGGWETRARIPVLLEVNISGDETKTGVPPDQVEGLLAGLGQYPGVSVRGLMGMAGRNRRPDLACAEFARLRELRDRLRSRCPEGSALDELSMGMSGDFEEAIREGATIVRIGSLLFEGLLPAGTVPAMGEIGGSG
jgi:pyridoxal phosphate enzyme (YggS family)